MTTGTSAARCAAMATLLLSSALPSVVLAQTALDAGSNASAPPTPPDEIIVTAQKRSQNLQDVPVSLQVLDTRKLDQLQVRNFEDYVKYLPSVSITGANPGANATVVVRGIATDGGNYVQGALPTVGIYLDEQPITTINGAIDLHIYDIAGRSAGRAARNAVRRIERSGDDQDHLQQARSDEVQRGLRPRVERLHRARCRRPGRGLHQSTARRPGRAARRRLLRPCGRLHPQSSFQPHL